MVDLRLRAVEKDITEETGAMITTAKTIEDLRKAMVQIMGQMERGTGEGGGNEERSEAGQRADGR